MSWLPPSDGRLPITDTVALSYEIGWLRHRRIFTVPSGQKKPRILYEYGAFLVPPAGIEPAQYRYRGILSPLRLPVPPWRHDMIIPEGTPRVKRGIPFSLYFLLNIFLSSAPS